MMAFDSGRSLLHHFIRACSGSFAQHRNRDINHHIGMQSHRNRVIANRFQRALRHADLRFLNREALLGHRFRDIVIGHRTEQTAVDARFLRNLARPTVQFFALRLGCSQLMC